MKKERKYKKHRNTKPTYTILSKTLQWSKHFQNDIKTFTRTHPT